MKPFRIVLALALALGPAFALPRPAAASDGTLLSESFRDGSTPPGRWRMVNALGRHTPCLTAATSPPAGSLPACNAGASDPVGEGAFQLTDNSANDGGDLLLDQAIPTRAGLHISFDAYQFHSSTARGADGIAFFLIDGAQTDLRPGQTGGMLGYKGLPGGIVGIGLDEFGNFSSGRVFTTGPGVRPNSVVVRGAESTGYKYVQGTTAPGPLAVDTATSRNRARRTVHLDLSTSNILSVGIDFHDGAGPIPVVDRLDLDNIPGQPKLPPTIKLGFAASTGAATNFHEIRDLAVTTLRPDLSVRVSGPDTVRPNATGTVRLSVANAVSAGPTSGPVTVRYTMPARFKSGAAFTIGSATGPGWTCSTAGETVTCTRSDVLPPGATAPPITVPYATGSAVFQGLGTTATASVPGLPDSTSIFPISSETAAGPDLSTALAHQGRSVPGGTLTYRLTVLNAATAGPTTAPVIATFTAPPGSTITATAPGPGWDCSQSGQRVACVRTAALAPGTAAPPVLVSVRVPPYACGCTLTATAGVNTDGEVNVGDNTAPPDNVVVAATAPSLSASISHDGIAVPGETVIVHFNAANAVSAGPTDDTVTATLRLPPGLTVQDAARDVRGDGWACRAAGGLVTCTRPGVGSDALAPGSFYPEIGVRAQVSGTGGMVITGTLTSGTVAGPVSPDQLTVAPQPGPARTGLQITSSGSPGEYVAGSPFTYTVTVTNKGPGKATGAELAVDLPAVWQRIAWKCQATEGSSCPQPERIGGVPQPITGSLDTVIDVAPGGKVVLTVSCSLSWRQLGPMDFAAGISPPPGAVDSECGDGCAAPLQVPEALRRR